MSLSAGTTCPAAPAVHLQQGVLHFAHFAHLYTEPRQGCCLRWHGSGCALVPTSAVHRRQHGTSLPGVRLQIGSMSNPSTEASYEGA